MNAQRINNGQIVIGTKVLLPVGVMGFRKGTITGVTERYSIPSNGMYPEKNSDRFVVVAFDDGATEDIMVGRLDREVMK